MNPSFFLSTRHISNSFLNTKVLSTFKLITNSNFMKVFTVIILLIFSTTSLFGQKTISTPYFKFKCECSEVENAYNPGNKSYNYSYQTLDGKSIYMISISVSSIDQAGFLKAIRNSGTFDYVDTKFKGLNAIIADMTLNGQYGKHVGFFKNTNGFSIIVASTSKLLVENLYKNFVISLILF